MSTPSYRGPGQPAVASGGIAGIGGLFGGSTPAYVGDGQPSSAASGGLLGGLFGGGAPAYLAAPQSSMSTSGEPPPCGATDPDPFGSGPIAIVIPRQGG